jgi:cysteine desulfurase
MSDPIYLDHNGTTPVDLEVLEAMLPYLRGEFGNPSSTTPWGRRARSAIEQARAEVAHLINARPDEIIFLSGGTEASNHAIRGFADKAVASRRRIVTSTVEHPATENPCRRLEQAGFEVVRVPVSRNGLVDVEAAAVAIGPSTALVTIIHAQNETGVLQPVTALARRAAAVGAPIHVDASQSVGKVPIDVAAWGIDAMTIAGHKLYAPKGIGALFLRRGHDLPSVLAGAGQEQGRRPGTENVPYIVGLGRACSIAARRLVEDAARIARLRDQLWQQLAKEVPGIERVGAGAPSLPNTLNVLFPGMAGNAVLATTPSVAASTGSACHAGEDRPSAIILAHGYPAEQAVGAVRLTLGRATTAQDVTRAARALSSTWQQLSKPPVAC